MTSTDQIASIFARTRRLIYRGQFDDNGEGGALRRRAGASVTTQRDKAPRDRGSRLRCATMERFLGDAVVSLNTERLSGASRGLIGLVLGEGCHRRNAPADVRLTRCAPPSRPLRAAARWPSASLDRGCAPRRWGDQAGTKKRRSQPNQETWLGARKTPARRAARDQAAARAWRTSRALSMMRSD
jgi:hypothetical protein